MAIWVGSDARKKEALRVLTTAAVEKEHQPVPGVATEGGPYTLTDVAMIEGFRGRSYPRLRATVEEIRKAAARHVVREGQIAAHFRLGIHEVLEALESKEPYTRTAMERIAEAKNLLEELARSEP